MRVMEITDDRALAPADRPAPRATGTQAEVAVAFCGVCGSDLHMLQDTEFPTQSVLGHEFSGVVTAVGHDVTAVSVGDRVAVLPYESCGRCRYCATERENLCVTGGHFGRIFGVDLPGGLSQTVVADESSLLRLPDSATLEMGALAEPVAVAHRAAGRVVSAQGDPVVVLGAGPIGVLVSLTLLAKGFTDVTVVERNRTRRKVAESVGLDVVAADESGLTEQLEQLDAATFVDCTGAPAAIAAQVAAVRRGGRVVLVGLGDSVQIDASSAIYREVEIVGSAGYSRSDFNHAVELLASAAIPVSALVTRVAHVTEAADVFADLADPGTAHVKVLLQH